MVLGKLPVPGRPTIWITVGQGPIVGQSGGQLYGKQLFTWLSLVVSLMALHHPTIHTGSCPTVIQIYPVPSHHPTTHVGWFFLA